MKKLLAYLFLAIYLFSFTEAKQVLRLPVLIEHYISHNEGQQELGVIAFFKMHYWDTPVKDSDYHDDMNLPFKSHTNCNFALTGLQIPPKNIEISFEVKDIPVQKVQNFSYSEHFTKPYYRFIFRPPISI